MNAQVFYLESQESLYRRISSLLKSHIFDDEGVDIDRRIISDDYTKEESQEYLRLLKASMISTHDFTLLVEDSEGNWSYMGYDTRPKGARVLRVLRKSIVSMFPAVAVMDRLVMAPKGIHDALTAENFTWMLKPLEMGGVLLVDFEEPNSVGDGARQVGIRLGIEIAKLCRRHMLMNRSLSPNFETLSKLLKIDKKYFEKHREEILESMVKLRPEIVSGPARVGKQSGVIVDIHNESKKDLEDVRVQVRAPKGALAAPVVNTLNFRASGEVAQKIQFEILPAAVPYCPLEVRFEISETSQFYAPFSAPLILDVIP
jgi:hypothetical protein